MLYIPEHYKTFTFMAVDPGVNNLGVAIFEIATRTGEILNISIESIVTDKLYGHYGMDREFVCDRDIKLWKIGDCIERLCDIYNICAFVNESPFYNKLMPAAYGSLNEVVYACRKAVRCYNPYTYIDSISPQGVKKGVGAAGQKGKEIMKDKVFAIRELMDSLDYHPLDLSEHDIDAMAVGYTYRNTVLKAQEGWL